MIPIRTDEEIGILRKSAQILVNTFREVEHYIEPGIPTQKLNEIAEIAIQDGGGRPAFKGYNGFPASICTSIDHEVVHGIPSHRVLSEGEILSLDIGVEFRGYFSDAAKTYGIGLISNDKARLIEITKNALYRGIKKCREGNRLTDISHAIQSYTESKQTNVVRELVGHGIGQKLHEEPQIPNFGAPHRGPKLQAGMVFAIEPMVNQGQCEVFIMEDGWTVVTKDALPSAHFEHTVLITEGKPEILTLGIEKNI